MSIGESAEWREVSKREICPVCERPDWCAVTGPEGNPDAAYCMRIPSDLVKGDGWIHRLKDHGLDAAPRRKSPTSKAPPNAKPNDATVYPTAEAAVASYARQLGKPDRQWRYRRAVEGVRTIRYGRDGQPPIDPATGEPYVEVRYSDRLLMALLRANAPEKFGGRAVTFQQAAPAPLVTLYQLPGNYGVASDDSRL